MLLQAPCRYARGCWQDRQSRVFHSSRVQLRHLRRAPGSVGAPGPGGRAGEAEDDEGCLVIVVIVVLVVMALDLVLVLVQVLALVRDEGAGGCAGAGPAVGARVVLG